jgi:hypothetical protein
MYIPSTYLAIAYFLTYLPIWETYFLQYWLPRWNQILTQLRFIHNWVMTGIQWMVHWRGRWFNVATLYTCNSPDVGCLKLSWEIVRWTYKNPNKLLYYIVCVCVCVLKQTRKSSLQRRRTRGVSQCGLAISATKYRKAKEELWKFKYFTMQQYNLWKTPLKETKILPRYH